MKPLKQIFIYNFFKKLIKCYLIAIFVALIGDGIFYVFLCDSNCNFFNLSYGMLRYIYIILPICLLCRLLVEIFNFQQQKK